MPTLTYYRNWCVNCQDFTLHLPKNDNHVCKCGKDFEEVLLSDIPENKILEQRRRYKDSQIKYVHNMVDYVMNMGKNDPFSSNIRREDIIESSAGLKEIEAKANAKRNEEKEFKVSELEKYRYVERNSPCLCDSGKKYKKCCYIRIESYK